MNVVCCLCFRSCEAGHPLCHRSKGCHKDCQQRKAQRVCSYEGKTVLFLNKKVNDFYLQTDTGHFFLDISNAFFIFINLRLTGATNPTMQRDKVIEKLSLLQELFLGVF